VSPPRIWSPEGTTVTASAPLAQTAGALAGRRIGVLDNGKPNARLLLTELAERLAARTSAEVALVTAKATAATPAEPEILRQLEAADLVLTGSAD
jgi:hypothetical protein